MGPQSVLFVPVTFDGKRPFTVKEAQQALENQNQRFVQWSYGQASLTFTVTDWVQVPADGSNCNWQSGARNADAVLAQRGYVAANYKKRVYQMPTTGPCGWGNFTIGAGPSFLMADGPGPAILHELGHAFGLGHADGLDCGDQMIAAAGCSRIGYINPMDPMGQGGGPYDLPHQFMLGWVGQPNGPPMISATSSGTYAIGNLDDQDKRKPKGMRIARVRDGVQFGWLYIEHRGSPGEKGVFILSSDLNSDVNNLLLDATPRGDYGDLELMVGQSVTDPIAGITITNVRSDLSGATLRITVDATDSAHALTPR